MKKFTAILLTVVVLAASFAMYASASVPEFSNYPVSIYKLFVAPTLDGVINEGEYGEKIHSVDYDNPQFDDYHDPDHRINADFYAAWTEDGVYVAWKVYSEFNHCPAYDGMMCIYSLAQLVTTPVHPLESIHGECNNLGFCINSDDGNPYKTVFTGPSDIEDIQFNGKRDDVANTTTYEVFLPWDAVTLGVVGEEGTVIGLSYALGVQHDFSVDPGMCEWQDAVLSGMTYDKCAVVTLEGALPGTPTSAPVADDTTDTTDTTTDAGTATAPVTADPFTAVAVVMAVSAGAALVIKKRR